MRRDRLRPAVTTALVVVSCWLPLTLSSPRAQEAAKPGPPTDLGRAAGQPPPAAKSKSANPPAPSKNPEQTPPRPAAQAQPAPPAPAEQQPQAPAPDVRLANPAGEFEPVIHARGAKVTTCMDRILAQSHEIIDRPHTAISTWNQAAPNEHPFQSVIGLTYPSKVAPNGIAVIFAAPLAGDKCEGGSVQVIPTAQPCSTVQARLITVGRTIGMLQAMPVVETRDGSREILVPGAAGGCVIVTARHR